MIKTFYHYLVSFAMLMLAVGGSIGAFMSIADYVSPQPYIQTLNEYKQSSQYDYEGNKTTVKIDDKQLKENYDAMVKSEKERAKENALNGLVKSLGFIVIPLPLFIYFQRQSRKEKTV